MVDMKDQAGFIKEVQARFERKLKQNEIEILELWRGHLEKLASMKPEGIASLQLHIRKVSEMMGNRIKTLKREDHEGYR